MRKRETYNLAPGRCAINLKRTLVNSALRLLPDAAMRRLVGQHATIFVLHQMESAAHGSRGHDPAFVESTLAWLRRHRYNILSVEELVRHWLATGRLPSKAVCFTIDDGYLNQAEIAGPLFAAYDVPLTYFLTVDFVNGSLWPWDDQVRHAFEKSDRTSATLEFGGRFPAMQVAFPDPTSLYLTVTRVRNYLKTQPNDEIYAVVRTIFNDLAVDYPASVPPYLAPMTWADAERLEQAGHAMAPHSLTHRILSRLPAAEQEREIVESCVAVKDRFPNSAPIFGFPTGRPEDIPEHALRIVAREGMLASASTDARPVLPTDLQASRDLTPLLPRFSLPADAVDVRQYASWIERVKGHFRRCG